MLALLVAVSEGGGFNPLNLDDWSNTLWTVLIFFAALPVMWKFVFGPICRALDARDGRARRAVAEAEAARDAAKRTQSEIEARLARADAEAAALLARAREQGERDARDALGRAEAEIGRARDRSLREIEAARARALHEIREEVVDLALEGARVVLGRNLDAEDHRRLVRQTIEGVGAPRRGS